MDQMALTRLGDFAVIRQVAEEIAALLSPKRIYLYSHKLNCQGALTSFKLCVVGDFADKHKAEQSIHWEIDSQLPFDLLLYTTQEWEELSATHHTFACHIQKTGIIVYE